MSEDSLVKIKIAQNHIKNLEQINEKFLKNLQLNCKSENLPNSIEMQDGVIATEAFGKKISAAPRMVRHGEKDFAIEYTFLHKAGENCTLIWQFFLTNNGVLVLDLNRDESRLCDFNNLYVADHLLTNIGVAVLQSALFSPSQLPSS